MSVRDLALRMDNLISTSPVIYAKPYQTVEEVDDIMRRYNIRRLSVVDGDKIVGMVTVRDLAILLSPMPEILVCENSVSNDIARISSQSRHISIMTRITLQL